MSLNQELILEGVRVLCIEASDMIRKANQKLGDAGIGRADRSRRALTLAISEVEEALGRVVDKQI